MSITEIVGDQNSDFWAHLESETAYIYCYITCKFFYSWAENDTPEAFIWSRNVDDEYGITIE